jgi:hypothetical protein
MPKSKRQGKNQSKKPAKAQASPLSLKEQLAQKRKATKERREFISFTTATVFASLVLGILLFPIGGAKAAGGAIGTILCLAFSYKYPRKALWGFLIYMPFGGTVTYALAGGNALFQLAKDSFYIPALLALVQECFQKRLPILLPKGLKPSLIILLICVVLTLLVANGSQQFSPSRGDDKPLAMGILGLKVLLGYLPLITCAYYLIRTKQELLFLTRLHVILAIVCCGLGFIQYWMLLTDRCHGTRGLVGDALFKASLEARCFVGGSLLYTPEEGVIRLPGTFVAPWQWGWFLISNAFFTYASAFSDPSAFVWRPIGLVGMAAVFVMALISGQRIALALVPLVTVILLILTGQITNLKRFLPIAAGLGLVVAIAFILFPDLVQERVDSFVGRWNASPPTEFISDQAEFTSKGGSFFGNGLGRATNSTRIFGNTVLIETYYPKLLYEMGPLGVLGFLGLVTTLTVITFKAYRSVKDKNLRSFGASFWVFVLVISYNTYYYPLDVDPVTVYYWFFAGVILKLPEIDRQEQEKLMAGQDNEFQPQKQRGLKASRRRFRAKTP